MKDTMENDNKEIKEKGIVKKIVGYMNERKLLTKLKIGEHQIPGENGQAIKVVPTRSIRTKNGHIFTHIKETKDMKNAEFFTGYLENEIVEQIVEETKKKEEANKDNKDNKKNKRIVIILPIMLGIAISLNSCSATQEVVETKETPIDWEYYNTKNP